MRRARRHVASRVAGRARDDALAMCVVRARAREGRARADALAREAETLARLARDDDARRAFTAWMCERAGDAPRMWCRVVDVERAIETFCAARADDAAARAAARATLRATLAEDGVDDEDDDGDRDDAGAAVMERRDDGASRSTRVRCALDAVEGTATLAWTEPATLARWLERGFARLERFETMRRRRVELVERRSRASKSSSAASVKIEDADASAVSASGLSREKIRADLDACDGIDDETSDRVYAVVKSWLADTRERERAVSELSTLVRDGDALRRLQRRELVVNALEAWQEFRDAVVAFELGHEEFTGASRRINYYLRECDRCYRRVMPDAASADALALALGDELRAYEFALRAHAPSGRELSDLARACVLAVRAMNSLDASSGATATPRVIDSGYADGETDCKVILRDAMRDLRAARDDLAASGDARLDRALEAPGAITSSIVDELHREPDRSTARAASALDVAALHRRVRPVVERYADTALRGVVDRVVRALNREGTHLAYGIELARCAAFTALVSGAARAHAEHADDQWLRAALEAFEEDDDAGAAARGSTRRGSSSKKSTQTANAPKRSSDDDKSASIRRAAASPPPPGGAAPLAPAPERDDAAEREHRGSWITARSRRKPGGSVTARAEMAPSEDAVVASSPRGVSGCRLARRRRAPTIPPPRAVVVVSRDDGAVSVAPNDDDATNGVPAPVPAPSVGLAGRPDFPPKPKPLGVASLRSVAEYRRMLDTESASERESRLKEFPALPLRSTMSEVELATTCRPPAPPGPPPPRRPKTWAEAKRALDGVALPSLIKIK